MPDYLMGEYGDGTVADGCRKQLLLAAILREVNVPNEPRAASAPFGG